MPAPTYLAGTGKDGSQTSYTFANMRHRVANFHIVRFLLAGCQFSSNSVPLVAIAPD